MDRETPVRQPRRPLGRLARAVGLALALSIPSVGTVAIGADPADDIVVVVSEDSDVTRMSAREVRKLFLGKSRTLPDGSRAVLVRFEPATSSFNKRVLNRSNAQVDAAWSRLRFSGRVRAPRRFDAMEDLARFIADTPSAIAYVPAGLATTDLRAVFVAPR